MKQELQSPEYTKCEFPILRTKMGQSERERLEIMLVTESRDMMTRFAGLVVSFFDNMLESKEITVKRVISKLRTYGSFTPIFKGNQESFLRDRLKSLPKDPDFDDVMEVVVEYSSFFNFDLFRFLVHHCGSEQDKLRLAKYEIEFDEYIKRKVFECPSQLGEISDSELEGTLVVKVDQHYDNCSAYQLQLLKKKICDVLHITLMKLCRVQSGCLCLTFQIPHHVLQSILPLSSDQEEMLVKHHVLSLKAADYLFESKVRLIYVP
jgi:hypothetical protein